MSRTVLALVPHPDDAEIYAGGLLAKLASEGAGVYIVVATDGRCGSFLEDSAELVELRSEEMRSSAAALGAEPPTLLGFPDMGLDALPAGVLRQRFVHAIRLRRPDIVVAQDPYALYEPHPDHRAVAWAATEAINAAGLPLIYPEHGAEGLAPHVVTEKYFYGDTLPGANKIVDITPWMDTKLAAVAEHRSQVVFLVEGLLRQARVAGLDVAAALGPTAESPASLLAWGLRQRAAGVGAQAGVAYAEAYRYERFNPLIEAILVQSSQGGSAINA